MQTVSRNDDRLACRRGAHRMRVPCETQRRDIGCGGAPAVGDQLTDLRLLEQGVPVDHCKPTELMPHPHNPDEPEPKGLSLTE